jgi:hypothetical protein
MSKPTHEHHAGSPEDWIEDAAFLSLFFVAIAIAIVIVGLMIVL